MRIRILARASRVVILIPRGREKDSQTPERYVNVPYVIGHIMGGPSAAADDLLFVLSKIEVFC